MWHYRSPVPLKLFRESHHRAAGSASCPAQLSASLDLALIVALSGLQPVQHPPASDLDAEPCLPQSFFTWYFEVGSLTWTQNSQIQLVQPAYWLSHSLCLWALDLQTDHLALVPMWVLGISTLVLTLVQQAPYHLSSPLPYSCLMCICTVYVFAAPYKFWSTEFMLSFIREYFPVSLWFGNLLVKCILFQSPVICDRHSFPFSCFQFHQDAVRNDTW